MAKQSRSTIFDLEEGLLDTAKLAGVIVDPQPLAYKQERETQFRDAVVSSLVRAPCGALHRHCGHVRRYPRPYP